ncbi:type IV pilus secretin PilQ family protein [Catenovulum sp. 2E275]|uniref:type IV pilus secretin PilQ n=1 Tax=Catenovulum sp. 2E275 TaxID=2980497 RepID=UPI0021D14E11|nr:type IV pilus secretin PilQ family protein [Catenovulum sp. 2E275]MCU4675835.1 type IV pilus secretin PilQ family protein [Catenovulum sp. 2E275]
MKNNKTYLYSYLFLICLFYCLPSRLYAQEQASPTLYEIKYQPTMRDAIEIELVFDQIIAKPEIQVSNNPAAISLNFDNAKFENYLTTTQIDHAGVNKINARQQGKILTLNIELEYLKIYKTRSSGNRFFIAIANNLNTGANDKTAQSKYINSLDTIDFRHAENNSGRVLVFMKNKAAAIDVTERNNKIIAVFHNTRILDELLYQMDVTDFGTIVDNIETFRNDDSARIEISMNAPFDYKYQQIDSIFSLDIVAENKNKGVSNRYNGKPISLNFQDIEVRSVLQIIADYNNFNLVTSDSVSGNVTLRLDGVPWDQALDIILKIKGLDKRMEGSILLVAPSEEIAAREAKELETRKQVEELSPLYSEFVQINYAKATEIAAMLQGEQSKMLSERGAVSVDERTNTLLIRDTGSNIENVKKLVNILDIPVKQVTIESRIVTVNDNLSEELGIRWGFSDQQNSDGVSGSLEGANTIASGVIPPLNQRMNVNLPVANAAGSIGLSIARLSDGTILDLELTALETENKGEIIASPRITTANQKTAYIEQGTEIPFVQAASSGATAVTFKKAVLSLQVTPQITPDNKIILDLIITQDTRGDTVDTSTGSAVAIDTQEIGTQVLVDNGETIVLGGIYQQQIVNTESKVPLLGDIPYVGRLFKKSREFNEKKELLIFVTPRIVTEKL